MNTEDFINSIKQVVRDSTINGVISLIECPPCVVPRSGRLRAEERPVFSS
jgi:hypothetical protein